MNSCIPLVLAIIAGLAAAATSSAALHAEPANLEFNRDVLPILSEHCFACHGFDKSTREAGLRLDAREGATLELESGARAIVPGDIQASELVRRIDSADANEQMPPAESGKQLTPTQKDTLRRWIAQGAHYQPHWAYIAPRHTEPPPATTRTHPIDRWIRARLADENVKISPEADRATLIRRVTLDLNGLPPTPLEIDAFVSDARGDAYQRVVERLLASEYFGERWARWWLDLAQYADSDGYLQDTPRPSAWRYRQWVVDALNRDLPFDQFTIQQLAGDLLPDATTSQRMATGFLRNTLSNREGGANLEEYRVRQVIDRTTTTGTVWLGLTFGCAECHDHKFDAISQREFYRLYAFFDDADEVNVDAPLPGEIDPHREAQLVRDQKRAELLAPMAAQVAELQAAWEKRMLHARAHPGEDGRWDRRVEVLGLIWGQAEGEGQLEGLNIMQIPPAQRTPDQRDRLLDYFLRRDVSDVQPGKSKELKLRQISTQLDALNKTVPPLSRAPTIERARLHRQAHVHLRGDFRKPGAAVQPGTLAALPPLNAGAKPDRLALARWLVAPENPLTARVTVNRLWQELFGRGLVATSENFGVRGQRPSHPELLDWLALEFTARGWSVKELLRIIVTSQTYRQSSRARPELAALDPSNALLARQSRLRLSAEAVRDTALAAGGLLNRTIGGPSVRPPQPDSVAKEGFGTVWETSKGADRYRRGLYTFIQRTSPFAQFVTFDLPDSSRSCTRRERSNTPLQALNLLNDPVFVEAAQALASRTWREAHGNDRERLAHAFLLTLARSPTYDESTRLLAYLQQQRSIFEADAAAAKKLLQDTPIEGSPADSAAWVALASVLLNLDEFITRE